jgi:hypothetical protein
VRPIIKLPSSTGSSYAPAKRTFSTEFHTPIVKGKHGDSGGVRGAAWLLKYWPLQRNESTEMTDPQMAACHAHIYPGLEMILTSYQTAIAAS